MNARDFSPIECGKVLPTHHSLLITEALQSPRAQPNYEAADEMADYAQTLPKRDLCAEFSALPTDQLMPEAEAAMTRLLQSGRPTDYAVVVALVRALKRKPLDGAIWIDGVKVPA